MSNIMKPGNRSINKNSQVCWSRFCTSVTKYLGKRQGKGRNTYIWLIVLEIFHMDGWCHCFWPKVRQYIMTIRKIVLEVVAYLMAAQPVSKHRKEPGISKASTTFKGKLLLCNLLPTDPNCFFFNLCMRLLFLCII